MLAKINRIKKNKDFAAIFKNAKSVKTSIFILKIRKNDLGLNRFGFVVSQKVSKKAVLRNKVRRRLSEAVKSRSGDIKKGYDVVFIALSGIEKKNYKEIKEAVNKCLNL